jgi:transcriptional regulator with XRE-family HTH domain
MNIVDHERLRKAREISRLSQSELAERVKVQPPVISHFENGKRSPSVITLRRLADALDVSVDYLLGRSDDPKGGATDPVGDTPLARVYRKMKGWDIETQEKADHLLGYLDKNKP